MIYIYVNNLILIYYMRVCVYIYIYYMRVCVYIYIIYIIMKKVKRLTKLVPSVVLIKLI